MQIFFMRTAKTLIRLGAHVKYGTFSHFAARMIPMYFAGLHTPLAPGTDLLLSKLDILHFELPNLRQIFHNIFIVLKLEPLPVFENKKQDEWQCRP